MNRISAGVAKAVLVVTIAQVAIASSADASRRIPFAIGMLAAVQASGGQNVCFTYAYDRNGNRVSKTNLTWGSGTWGSSIFGCFKWRTSP